MYIVNKHGITHSIEDGPLPAGARRATEAEAAAYDATTGVPVAEPASDKDLEIAQLRADLEAARKPATVTPGKATK